MYPAACAGVKALFRGSRAPTLAVADYGYIMEVGKVVMEGRELQDNEDVKQFYLGIGESSARRSFKGLKSYKRRKRWL